jgi:hypothetical protein
MMAAQHFIVTGRWQYTTRGIVAGPFKSRQEAIDAAIEAAGALDDPEVEVIVQDHDLQRETVWRGSQK